MATINELLDIANDSVTRVDFDTANETVSYTHLTLPTKRIV